jgi:ElaB/YqjD/DUF883 family membrane-anchored ribosome-binding protein
LHSIILEYVEHYSTQEIATMDQRTDEFNQAKGKIAGDIKTVIADSHDLLKAAANVSGASFTVAREKLDEKLSSAKASLIDASRPAVDKAKKTAAAANGYVHGNPWAFIGVAVAASALIGFLAAKRSFADAGQRDS